MESNTEAYFGRLDKAHELTRRAVVSAESAQNKEAAALRSAEAAIREALFGHYAAARERANAVLSLAPGSRDAESEAALALAMGQVTVAPDNDKIRHTARQPSASSDVYSWIWAMRVFSGCGRTS
jgi:hypothetical protein